MAAANVAQTSSYRFVTDAEKSTWDAKQNSLTADADYLTPATASSTYQPRGAYLTSFTETDPLFSAWDKTTGVFVTESQITDLQDYLTAETDPVFASSTAASITGTNVSNWNTAFGWGDHSIAGYLTQNQTINLSGDVTGSGTTTIATVIGNGKITNNMLAGSIASAKLIGTDISTVGTITSGIWNGTAIDVAHGGTGTGNGSITGTGALTFTAGGSSQNVTITPSVGGYAVLNGTVQTSALTGSGNRCVYVDASGNLHAKSEDCGTSSGGDNLGNHLLTQNLVLGSYWLSGDGGNEGIQIDSGGNVLVSGTLAAGNLSGTNTGDQTITLSGAVTGSGTSTIATALTGAGLDNIFSSSGLLRRTGANSYTIDASNYLTSYTETDPLFASSTAAAITNTNVGNWNTAFGWGDHSIAGYLTVASASSTYQPIGSYLTNLVGLDTDDLDQGGSNLYSQWATAGSNIYYATGNVGIGTNLPQQKLTLGSGSSIAIEMAPPGAPTLICNTTGGSLADGDYYYKIAASDGIGTTIAGAAATCAISGGGGSGSVSISWTAVTGAVSYQVFGNTSGYTAYWEVSTNSYTDTGAVGTAGTVPTVTTAYAVKLNGSGDSWLLGGNLNVAQAIVPQTLQYAEINYTKGAQTLDQIAATVNGSDSATVAAYMNNTWSVSFSALVLNNANLTALKAADIVNNANLAVAKAATIFDSANLTAAKAASIFDNSNLTATKAASIVDSANLVAAKAATIFDSANLTAAKAASIFDNSNLASAKAASIIDHANFTAARVSAIADEANFTSSRIKAVLDTGSLTVADKIASLLDGSSLTATDSATHINAGTYATSTLALAFNSNYLAASKAASIIDSANLVTANAALIFNNVNLLAAKSALIFDNANLTATKAAAILNNANLTADNSQAIMYAMSSYGRQIDIITSGGSIATISSDVTANGINRYDNLTVNTARTLTLNTNATNIIIADTFTNNGIVAQSALGGAAGTAGFNGGGAGGRGGGGLIIIAKTFDNNNAITANGNVGANGSASMTGSGSGGNGGNGAMTRIGIDAIGSGGNGGYYSSTQGYGLGSSNGGGGGNSGATGWNAYGGNGGTVTQTAKTSSDLYNDLRRAAIDWWLQNVASKTPATIANFPSIYGAGGGGGFSYSAANVSGGGGGGGGGQVIVLADTLDNTGGTIFANAGNGSNGYQAQFGAGGGGGGGGLVYGLYRTTLTAAGTLSASAGTYGASGSSMVAATVGTVGTATTYSAVGADLAENYPVAEETDETGQIVEIEAGDVVSVASQATLAAFGQTSSPGQSSMYSAGLSELYGAESTVTAPSYAVSKTKVPYDRLTLGIVSTNPAIVIGPDNGNVVPIALNGRVPVKIDPQSLPINIGDYVTSSGTPGMAMKATRAGQVIGKALESWTPESGPASAQGSGEAKKTTAMVFVNLSWYDPDVYLEDANSLTLKKEETVAATSTTITSTVSMESNASGTEAIESASTTVSQIVTGLSATESGANSNYQIFGSDNQAIIRVAAFSDLVAGNIRAGKLDTQELTIGSVGLSDYIKGLSLFPQTATSTFENSIDSLLAAASSTLTISEDGSIDVATTTLDQVGQEQTLIDKFTSLIRFVLGKLGLFVENGVAKLKEIAVDTFTAKKATIEEINIQKINITDQATGETYCTWIANGEWQKVKGLCDEAVVKKEDLKVESKTIDSEISNQSTGNNTETETTNSSTTIDLEQNSGADNDENSSTTIIVEDSFDMEEPSAEDKNSSADETTASEADATDETSANTNENESKNTNTETSDDPATEPAASEPNAITPETSETSIIPDLPK